MMYFKAFLFDLVYTVLYFETNLTLCTVHINTGSIRNCYMILFINPGNALTKTVKPQEIAVGLQLYGLF